MLDLIGKRRYVYVLSGILVVISLIFVLATLVPNGGVGLRFSIAYTGGTVWEVHFQEGTPAPDEVRGVLDELDLEGEVAITRAEDREYLLIRTEALALQEVVEGSATEPSKQEETGTPASPAATAAVSASADASASPDASPAVDASASPDAGGLAPLGDASDDGGAGVQLPTEGRFGELAAALQAAFGPIDEVRQQDSVGPVVSQELVWQTFMLVLMASGAIMVWVAYRFRDLRMGVTTLVSLLQVVIITVGSFAVLGTLIGLQVDGLFVTALLTVIGYSVHDTIVVFDRIRENRQRYSGEPFDSVVNYSMVQTIGRSVTTTLTLVVTLVALLLLGGAAIQPFILAVLIGVVVGTFSSIFIASPLFLDWHLWADQRKDRQPAEVKAQRSAA